MKNLIENLINLKAQKTGIESQIREIESELSKKINTKLEGTSHEIVDKYKVTVTNSLNRKLDEKAYKLIEESLPEQLRPVKYKPSIDLKVLRALELIDSSITSQFISTKPAKASVKVEIIE